MFELEDLIECEQIINDSTDALEFIKGPTKQIKSEEERNSLIQRIQQHIDDAKIKMKEIFKNNPELEPQWILHKITK
jgi:hypothetical protein